MPGLRNTLRELNAGTLHSGSKNGPIVTNRKQGIAIALSEGRKAGENVAPPPKTKGHHAKAKHHHAKAGDALKAGDTALAMHHTGHMMAALRQASTAAGSMDQATDEETGETAPDMESPEEDMAPPTSLRSRLSQFKKS